MIKYTQINYEERIIIADLYKRNKSYCHIAKWSNRKYYTIKEEIERNGRIINTKYLFILPAWHIRNIYKEEKNPKKIIVLLKIILNLKKE